MTQDLGITQSAEDGLMSRRNIKPVIKKVLCVWSEPHKVSVCVFVVLMS